MRTVDSSKYRHKITHLTSNALTDGVFLRVDERYKGKVTSGGSCVVFTASATGPATETCAQVETCTTERMSCILSTSE